MYREATDIMSVVIVKERRQKLKLYKDRGKKFRTIQVVLCMVCIFVMSYFDLFKIKWILLYVVIMVAFENIWDLIFDKKNKNQK